MELLLNAVSLKGFLPSLLIHSYKSSGGKTMFVEDNVLLHCFYRHTKLKSSETQPHNNNSEHHLSCLYLLFYAHWKGLEFLVPVLQTVSFSLATLKDRFFTPMFSHTPGRD